MQREIHLLNHGWSFSPTDNPCFAAARCPGRGWVPVDLPHQNVPLPVNYFSQSRSQFVSCYRRHLPTPAGMGEGRAFLDFDGVMMVAEVYVNGQPAFTHRGGYVGFSVDVTSFLRQRTGADNVVAVRVDARLHDDIPPCGRVMDFQTFGGIYRDVRLRVVPPCHLDDLFVRTPQPLAACKTVTATALLRNTRATDWQGAARLEVCDLHSRRIAAGPAIPCTAAAGGTAGIALTLEGLAGFTLWDLPDPQRYRARVTLVEGRQTLDRVETLFGFREAVFTKEGPFVLNGRSVDLIGLNRHQTYPYIGAAAPARLQRRDADILKHELGCNIVRTSHYPQSPHFLDRCDEIGLLVLEEIPGWGHIGDRAWKQLACRDVRAMILRDRNHPSVALWGVRINESADDHDFYTETNRLARELDPTRPTCGIRCSSGRKSEFLEDVYTANDFVYDASALDNPRIIRDPPETPYLITEFGGAHAAARVTDPLPCHLRQAIVHARVLNAALGHPKIAGALGWCAFDHQSQDWITADGLQPFGVMDVFRFPKFAAALYASQVSPHVQPVLRAVTRWRVGDLAGFDPETSQVSASHAAPLLVFSNCDRIEVFVGDQKRGDVLPARESFPHLPHPPFLCKGLGPIWGPSWQELRLVGYVGKKVVATQRFAADNGPANLILHADDAELIADGSDMTRLMICHADRYGNPQVFSHAVVSFKVEGHAAIVGPNPCALSGGLAAVYLKAGLKPGTARVVARAEGLPTRELSVRIRARLSPNASCSSS